MKTLKKSILGCIAALFVLSAPATMFANAAKGDVIVTLGEDLDEEERNGLLDEMNADDSSEIITVSNEEEYEYLGEYLGDDIGSNAISSSKITVTEVGAGLNVETNNITKVSNGMYANALITAGVEDADIYVTAPYPVSGTAGLTGLIKAYEIQNDIDISEDQKQVANEEMVKTSELGERIGMEEATELITRVKEELGDEQIESEEDLRNLIERIADELGIELTEEEMDGLVSLFNRMQDLNIDWNQVQDQISDVRDNLDEFLNREDTQSFISSFLDFINQLIDSLRGWFDGEGESA
ncbi:DUF1002 domain-containing protein [Salibacterium salarium]|uniref:DUF1002 domain-containing protein n=1 Tax=Salibacterium salarium TaxID=284579 RepID=A0A3R9Q0C8_9BACI|nr:DUF1002 domain-containing protein [Salibacterium salarium]RSL30921.1 DUF1002 domain-containing protein [Salibacterium salarium]